MTHSATNLRSGLFVLAGLLLLAAGVLALGLGWRLEPTTAAETYFDQSVQGLEIGTPVMELGVPVGRVAGITFVRNEYPHASQGIQHPSVDRMVVVRLALGRKAFPAMLRSGASRNYLRRQVAEGLRAHLAPQGLTGELNLELDFVDPHQHPAPSVPWKPRVVYIPAVPGTLTKLTNAAEQVLGRLKDVDVTALVASATSLVNEMRATNREARATLASPQVDTILENVAQATGNLDDLLAAAEQNGPPALSDARDAARHVDRVAARFDRATSQKSIDHAIQDFAVTASDARRAAAALPAVLQETRETLRQVRLLLGYGSGNLAATVSDVDQLAQTLNNLAAGMKAYPSQLIFGQAPPHVSYHLRSQR